jgi:hypothetical protein
MKTEQEIRDRLEAKMKELGVIKTEYDHLLGSIYGDKYIEDVCADYVAVASEIRALRWILGEVSK